MATESRAYLDCMSAKPGPEAAFHFISSATKLGNRGLPLME
jgi:hypothetical protein